MSVTELFARLRIAAVLITILILPWLTPTPKGLVGQLRVAVYFNPDKLNQAILDRVRASVEGRRLSFPNFYNLQFWEISDAKFNETVKKVQLIGAWVDPVPVNWWYTATIPSNMRSTNNTIVVHEPAARTRFAYLVGHTLDSYLHSNYPRDVPVLSDSRSLAYYGNDGIIRHANVRYVTLLSGSSYSYILEAEGAQPTPVHVDGSGETGSIRIGNNFLQLLAIGAATSLRSVGSIEAESEHPVGFSAGAPSLLNRVFVIPCG